MIQATNAKMRVGDMDRPLSEVLVDLHVYIVPPNLWQEQLHSASNEIISNTVSAGFLRVHPETTVTMLREEIVRQIGMDLVPTDYVFLKSVGRCLTRVKARQEQQMKVKHFLPPHAYCPEIFLMEPTLAMRNLISSDDETSGRQSFEQSNTTRSHASLRQVDGRGSHGIYHKRGHSQQNGQMDSGFGRDSLLAPNDLALESPKRGQRAHFDDTEGSGSEDDGQGRRRSSQRSKAASKSDGSRSRGSRSPGKSPGKNSLSPEHAVSKRSSYQDAVTSREGGVTSRDPRGSVGVVSPSRREGEELENGVSDSSGPYGSPGRGGSRGVSPEGADNRSPGRGRGSRATNQSNRSHPSQAGHASSSPDSKPARSRQSKHSKHSTPGARTPGARGTPSDDEFAAQLGLEREPTLTLEEQQLALKEKLDKIRHDRKNLEIKREEMVKKAKYLQSKTTSRRNQARDVWKKRYFEEKKKTPPLEDKSNRLRMELENLHRKIVGQMEGGNSKNARPHDQKVLKPSRQNNLRINATKLNHEIEELQRRVDDAKMKLTGEVKLRGQAEAELRALRQELTQRKINVTLTRSQRLDQMAMDQGAGREGAPASGRDQVWEGRDRNRAASPGAQYE